MHAEIRKIPPEEVAEYIEEFWTTSHNDTYTTMAGLADIWEGPVPEGGGHGFSNTVFGIKAFADKIYVVQGTMPTFIKVFSPNGIDVYDIFSYGVFCTFQNSNPYGSFDVISENTIVIGPILYDLTKLFGIFTGVDARALTQDTWIQYSIQRINSISWLSAVRTYDGWELYVNKLESYENCLPCIVKQALKKEGFEFNCIDEEIDLNMNGLGINGYSTGRNGAGGPSVSRSGGFQNFTKHAYDSGTDALECMSALDDYTVAFNKSSINPKDIGLIGEKVSKKCSTLVFRNVVSITEYKKRGVLVHDEYISKKINLDTSANKYLLDESKGLIVLIMPLLEEISNSTGDTLATKNLFSTQIFWAPIYFALNTYELKELPDTDNLYTIASRISFDDFLLMLVNAAASFTPSSGTEPSMTGRIGWSIMSDINHTPKKLDKNSATFFKFPYNCISISLVSILPRHDLDSVCGVETRKDGMYIWAWKDYGWFRTGIRKDADFDLMCYKITSNGDSVLLDTISIGDSLTPVIGDTKAVGYNKSTRTWTILDYYISDSHTGSIKAVQSFVQANSQMGDLMDRESIISSSNLNEVTSYGADNSRYLPDGMLESDWEEIDLDTGYGQGYPWPGPT